MAILSRQYFTNRSTNNPYKTMHANTVSFLSAILFTDSLISDPANQVLSKDYLVTSFNTDAFAYASATLTEFDNLLSSEFHISFQAICQINDWDKEQVYYALNGSINLHPLNLSTGQYGHLGQKLHTIAQQIQPYKVELDYRGQLAILAD